MENAPKQEPLIMSGNVQGFELPRGCLMTSSFILLPIVAMGIGLTYLGRSHQVLFAMMFLTLCMAAFVFARSISAKDKHP